MLIMITVTWKSLLNHCVLLRGIDVNVNKKVQLDATVCRHLFTARSLYMFQVSQHPSSGVSQTITATSGIGHNVGTATSFQRGLIRPSRKEVARNHELKKKSIDVTLQPWDLSHALVSSQSSCLGETKGSLPISWILLSSYIWGFTAV